MLLGSVVQIALDASTLTILCHHQALTRCPQLFQARLQVGCQTGVLKQKPGLAREVRDQFLLDRGKRLAGAL